MTLDPHEYAPGQAPEFRAIGLMRYIAFTVLTGGIYNLFWLFRVQAELAKADARMAGTKPLIVAYSILQVILVVGSLFGDERVPFYRSPLIAPYLVACVLMTIVAFKAVSAVRAHFFERLGLPLFTSGMLTFFFNLIYVQYLINRGVHLQAERNPMVGARFEAS